MASSNVATDYFAADDAALGYRHPSSWTAATIIAAILILVAQVLLVVPDLRKGELDLDESGTFLVATGRLHDALTAPTTFHSQPPLFYLVLRETSKISDEEPALRMVPWAFMIALGISLLLWAKELAPAGRVAAVAILLLSEYGRYISVEVRPYAMAALLACWSCLLFARLAGEYSRRRWIAYLVISVLMGYTVAVASWIFAAQGIATFIILIRRARNDGFREAIHSMRHILVALLIAGLIYLPYVVIVWQLQSSIGRASAGAALRDGLNPRYFVSGPVYLLRTAFGIGFVALGLAAYSAWRGLRRRDAFIGFLVLIVAVQISLSHGFLAGRSAFAFRYLAPAYPALCLLVGAGAQELMRRFRIAEPLLAGVALLTLLGAGYSFSKNRAERVGPWRQLRADLRKLPGKKIVFFDVGWDGQRLQYETRRDPDIRVLTRPGTGWSFGGDIMTPQYVNRSIQENQHATSMFLYQYDSVWKRANFDSAFAPSMERLGCKRTYVREVPTYTRAVADPSTGAVVVGYTCHAG
jgi:hypothetical protein